MFYFVHAHVLCCCSCFICLVWFHFLIVIHILKNRTTKLVRCHGAWRQNPVPVGWCLSFYHLTGQLTTIDSSQGLLVTVLELPNQVRYNGKLKTAPADFVVRVFSLVHEWTETLKRTGLHWIPQFSYSLYFTYTLRGTSKHTGPPAVHWPSLWSVLGLLSCPRAVWQWWVVITQFSISQLEYKLCSRPGVKSLIPQHLPEPEYAEECQWQSHTELHHFNILISNTLG